MSEENQDNKVEEKTKEQLEKEKEDEKKRQEEEEEKNQKLFKSMQRGNYTVHILVEKLMNLKKNDEELKMLPMVVMTCFGKTLRTQKILNEVFDYDYEEHFYFSGIDKSPEIMDNEKVELKVINIQEKDKKNYLGSIQYDLQRIYNENDDHAIHSQWIGLFNYENEENTGINGFLRVSIAVQHESDKKIILNSAGDDESKGNVFLPPQLKQNMSFNQLAFYIYEANNLPDMDESALSFNNDEETMFKDRKKECQGYVTIEYGGILLQTKTCEMRNDRIIWDQLIKIPIPQPRVSDKLFIKMYDKDTFGAELIGTYELNLEQVFPAFSHEKDPSKLNKFKDPKRIHFYGSCANESSNKGISTIMNDNSETGMLYKGSLTLKILKENPGDKPIKSVEDFKRIPSEVSDKSHESWNIKIRVYNYYVFNEKSVSDGKRAKFYISIGEKFTAFEDACKEHVFSFGNYNREYDSISMTIPKSDDKIENLPDIFFYVFMGGKRVAFQRVSPQDFMTIRKFCCLKMLPDIYNKSSSVLFKGGLLKFSMRIYDNNIDRPPKQEEEHVEKPKPKRGGFHRITAEESMKNADDGDISTDEDEEEKEFRLNRIKDKSPEEIKEMNKKKMRCYTVMFNVFQTKDLMIVDSKGTNDPFIEITYKHITKGTKKKEDLVNSVFNEAIIFEDVNFDLTDAKTYPVFLLKIFDKNRFLKNDLIGFRYISICDFKFDLDSFDKGHSKFIQLDHPFNCEQSSGNVLMSMNLFQDSFTDIIRKNEGNRELLNVTQKTEKYVIELNAIALRDLKSTGFTNSKKPYLVVDLDTIDVKSNGSLGKIKTVNNGYGNNPTINQVFKVELDLPVLTNNIPALSCYVEDFFLSIFKEKLGSFEISIRDCVVETKRQFDEMERKLEEFIEKQKEQEAYRKNEELQNKNKINPINAALNPMNNIEKPNDEKPCDEKPLKDIFPNKINPEEEEEEYLLDNVDDHNSESRLNIEPVDNSINDVENQNNQIKGMNYLKDNFKSLSANLLNDGVSREQLRKIFDAFCIVTSDEDKLLFTKILDNLDVIQFEPFVEKRNRPGDTQGKYGAVETELFVIPQEFYYKLGYRKENSDCSNTKISYRRQFFNTLSDKHRFKLPFTEEEKEKIRKKLGNSLFLANKILKSHEYEFHYESPFKTEHLIRGKTQMHKQDNRIFENIRDASKFTFNIKFNEMTPCDIKKVNKTSLHKEIPKSQLEKLSKGTFKYIVRVYTLDMFEQHIKRLERAKSLFSQKELDQAKSSGLHFLSKRSSVLKIKHKNERCFDFPKLQELVRVIPRKMNFLTEHEDLAKKLIAKRDVVVRVYILELEELANRDDFVEGVNGKSDPYVKVYLENDDPDNVVYADEKDHKEDVLDCKWAKHYDFNTNMPGSGMLHIDVLDYDNTFFHDLIGRASIDIESRYFHRGWENLSDKPIERVPIYSEDFFDPQGYVRLWIDILDKKETKKRNNPVFIQPRPVSQMEVRMVIWECEGLPNKDMEGNDIFFNVTIDKDAQGTDVHFNSWDGVGSFNWRIVLPVDYDESSNKEHFVNLQAYDYDIFSKDDFIAKKSFSIQKLLKDVDAYDVPLKLDKKYFNESIKKFYEEQKENCTTEEQKKAVDSMYKFYEFDSEDPKKIWITLDPGCRVEKDENGNPKKNENKNLISESCPFGRVCISLEILPKKIADECKVGLGRDEPNVNPFLPPPVGRMQWSWNPYTLICQFIPPRWRRKICLAMCALACVVYLCVLIPYVIYHISGEAVNPFR